MPPMSTSSMRNPKSPMAVPAIAAFFVRDARGCPFFTAEYEHAAAGVEECGGAADLVPGALGIVGFRLPCMVHKHQECPVLLGHPRHRIDGHAHVGRVFVLPRSRRAERINDDQCVPLEEPAVDAGRVAVIQIYLRVDGHREPPFEIFQIDLHRPREALVALLGEPSPLFKVQMQQPPTGARVDAPHRLPTGNAQRERLQADRLPAKP